MLESMILSLLLFGGSLVARVSARRRSASLALPCGLHRTRVSETRTSRTRLAGRLHEGVAPSVADRLLSGTRDVGYPSGRPSRHECTGRQHVAPPVLHARWGDAFSGPRR
jgi:hypothetical protein